jgi:simple sugar transport system ATP-binding protein
VSRVVERDASAPPAIELSGMTKRFGPLTALDDVSLALRPGSVHAILGENGAGKSTLVKCMMGYHRPDAGRLLVDGRKQTVANPRHAHALGFGMVYQHFTVVPSMTVAENLVLGRDDLPPVVRWAAERACIEAFQRRMPFRLELDRPVATLAAGEKQRLEILKQLFLGRRVLILDEPTSVLTPEEADQILGVVRDMAHEGRLTVVVITHKFREVQGFADEVTVLRGGRRVGGGPAGSFARDDLVRLMVGDGAMPSPAARRDTPAGRARLEVERLTVTGDRGAVTVCDLSLSVRGGEIVGVAGVSGNGQADLVEALAGQREPDAGAIRIAGEPYGRTRAEMRRHRVSVLTEEPLRNASVRAMSVAENLALRAFDEPPIAAGVVVRRRTIRAMGQELIARYRIRAAGPDARLETLSGGNVQRVVLARELSRDPAVLVAQNPCAGLDVAATVEIRGRIVSARNAGAAVLLISEDLDELLELADRIVVMFEGRLVHETTRQAADVHLIGRHMVGDRGHGGLRAPPKPPDARGAPA